MSELAFVNGEIVPLKDAKLPVEERAMFFGDGGYEVIRVYNGRPFMLDEHITRFKRTLDGLAIRFEHIEVKLKEVVYNLTEKSQLFNAQIYLQISRGTYRRQHYFPPVEPNLLGIIYEFNGYDESFYETGVALRSVKDYRWGRCDLKTLNLLPNVLERQRAMDLGFYDSVFISRGGIVREATSSNIYIRKGNKLYTHPLNRRILSGITRLKVNEIAKRLGYEVVEKPFRLRALYNADEVFITSTSIEVLPVNRVDKCQFKAPFEASKRLRDELRREALTT